MKKILSTLLFICLLMNQSFGQGNNVLFGIRNYSQHFEFVKIDCDSNTLTVLNYLPNYTYSGFYSSTYDSQMHKYYLCSGQKMQVINAVTGQLDTTFNITAIHPYFFTHITFNMADGFIYGIKLNYATSDQVMCKFDLISGALTDLFPINPKVGIGKGCKSGFDPYLGEYYIQSRNIAAINIYTGQVLYDLPLQNGTNEWLDHLAYSCKQQRFFGLTNNYHTVENYFSEIDTTTGITARVNPSPLPTYFYKQYLSGSTIDNVTDIYYYAAGGIIYGIDINTGNVVYNHDYGPNLQFLFLESASNYNCLTAGVEQLTDNFKLEVYPNPGTGVFTLEINSTNLIRYKLEVTDAQGKLIHQQFVTEHSSILNLQQAAKGIYFYKLIGDDAIYSGKILLN